MSRLIYEELNNKAVKEYKESLKIIENIYNDTKGSENEYYKYFKNIAEKILKLAYIETNFEQNFDNDIEFLKNQNNELFREIYPENYETSYANPKYCVEIFGDKTGQLLSYFYLRYRSYIGYAFRHKIYKMGEENETFIRAYYYVKDNDVNYDELSNIILVLEKENKQRDYEMSFKENFNKGYTYAYDIIKNSDLNDLRYLYKFGVSVTENDIKYAKFIQNMSEEKIDKVAITVADAFIGSFERENKNRNNRSTVRLMYNLGEERIIKKMINEFEANDIGVAILTPVTTDINKQYQYDHRFDNALYLDGEYTEIAKTSYENAANICDDILSDFCGTIYFERFGEQPFNPENKEECIKLSKDQTKFMQDFRNRASMVIEEHIPDKERSFCIIAFPTPEIGDKFEEIYEHTLEINTLDNETYKRIQLKMIDVLDLGDYVWIKGKNNNKTDIKVKLHSIIDATRETKFKSTLADVNIPVGEVFTSPTLTGTNGVLHVDTVFLGGLKYVDLELKFENGFVKEYSCRNFDDNEKNINFIKENLLFPHDTLPIGEFAIGTNTLAYAIANRYNIVDILPILIVEKMGPHFAIGDTCFSRSEDNPIYNNNGKQMIAVDNEKSILRKTNLEEAYTNVHTDITIPYDDIGFISVIKADGESIYIIKDGRFVLEGTEELNKPLDE